MTFSHFYVKRWRPTDFSVFLLTSFRCNCHTHTNHTQNSLNVLWSRELNLSTGKQNWKKKFLIQGFSVAATKEVVCWIFSPSSSESSMPGADHCKGHCHICWKSNHWYQHREYKFENRVVCTPWSAEELKIGSTFASYLKCSIWLML